MRAAGHVGQNMVWQVQPRYPSIHGREPLTIASQVPKQSSYVSQVVTVLVSEFVNVVAVCDRSVRVVVVAEVVAVVVTLDAEVDDAVVVPVVKVTVVVFVVAELVVSEPVVAVEVEVAVLVFVWVLQ
jgi:hypothetical protein